MRYNVIFTCASRRTSVVVQLHVCLQVPKGKDSEEELIAKAEKEIVRSGFPYEEFMNNGGWYDDDDQIEQLEGKTVES